MATFHINNARLYFLVVTLSRDYSIKYLESIKPGFERATSCKKYRSEIATQTKNSRLDYLID